MSRLLRIVLVGVLEVVALASLSGCALLTGSARPVADAVDHERWGRAASPIRTIECPDTAAEATPAPDTSPVFVVPADAADVILAVVADAPAAAASGDLVDAIESRLTAPCGSYERLAPIDVVRISDGSIGAAMGTESTCVLVRRVGEVTEQVHAPRVYLQPGELGCRGTTALGDLRPPH